MLAIGSVLIATKRRIGGLITLIGALWILTMGIYYAFQYSRIYETGLYPVANVVGVIILIVGIGTVLFYWTRIGLLKKR